LALDPLTIAQQGIQSSSDLIALQGLLDSTTQSTVIIDVDGDIDLQIGHRVIQIRRPKRLELERAEKLVIKRVSKALKGSKKARAEYATQTVSHVLREMQSALDWRPVANLALGLQDTIDRADIAKIDAFWAAVQAAALQTLEEEEEDDLLLLS
jgi:hypothetical protein